MILVRPDLNEQDLSREMDKLSQPILQNGGEIKSFEKWAKRKLAYPIKRFREGIYLLTNFKAKPETIVNVEKTWKLDENVLRAMVVVQKGAKNGKS